MSGATPQPIPKTVCAQMPGRNDLEQTSRLFETLIARLQAEGVASLQNLSVTFDPVSQDGTSMAIREEGKPASIFTVWLPTALRFGKAVSFQKARESYTVYVTRISCYN